MIVILKNGTQFKVSSANATILAKNIEGNDSITLVSEEDGPLVLLVNARSIEAIVPEKALVKPEGTPPVE